MEVISVMGKSYKKYPVVRQEKTDKKYWNRMIRNANIREPLRGSQYKKVKSNWSTWHYRWTLAEAIEDYDESPFHSTLESYIEYWKRCCLRK